MKFGYRHWEFEAVSHEEGMAICKFLDEGEERKQRLNAIRKHQGGHVFAPLFTCRCGLDAKDWYSGRMDTICPMLNKT